MKLKLIIGLILSIIATASSYFAKGLHNKKIVPQIVATDTIMHKVIGDSIYRIITNAKKVEITSLPQQSDSLKQAVSKKVTSKDLELMKFIVTNPKNYLTDTRVYGIFIPQFQAVYIQKKAKVILKYDFGLRKWGIFNAIDKQIAMFDLVSDNILRFACKMFLDNQFFHELLLTGQGGTNALSVYLGISLLNNKKAFIYDDSSLVEISRKLSHSC